MTIYSLIDNFDTTESAIYYYGRINQVKLFFLLELVTLQMVPDGSRWISNIMNQRPDKSRLPDLRKTILLLLFLKIL